MRITTTVKNKDDSELIDFCNTCLLGFISSQNIDSGYAYKDMQVWIVRKKNGNISVKGYRT
ncbi:TPA: hypothetical protein U2I51_003581 [Providencia rettgeri]|nr:hypothetical protein [Providencia rettgeri]